MPENGTHKAKVSHRRHLLVKNGNLLVAKMSTTALNGGEVLAHGSAGTIAGVEAAVKSAGGVFAMGLVAAISAAMAQIDYRHEINNLIDTYRDELAAKLKKPGHAITEKDLDVLAKGDAGRGIEANEVIAQELHKKRAERNLGVLVSAGSSLATLVAISAAFTMLAIAPPVTILGLLVEGLAGVGIYNVVKVPLKKIGHKLFGLDHQTTHDRIEGLVRDHEDGKTITRGQLLSVFASAQPKLDQYIAAIYGDHFDKLNAVDQQRAVQDPHIAAALDRVAAAINQGRLEVGELAFTVEGQASGYDPDRPHHEPRKENRLAALCRSVGIPIPGGHEAPPPSAPPVPPRAHTGMEFDNPAPAVPFTEQYAARKQAVRPRGQSPVPEH